MYFNKIDLQTWNRKESYHHFLNDMPCTYSMTVDLDITNLMKTIKTHQMKFFSVILYGISTIVNRHAEFRMDIDEQGNVGFYDCSNPCCAVFHQETETFTNVWTEYNADFKMFLKNYSNDMANYQNDSQSTKPLLYNNVFNVSCIPWTSFTGFHLNIQKGYDYFPPIFTIGKYFDDQQKTLLPIAIQVHHAVCDGFHLSRFVNELQEWGDILKMPNE